MPDEVRFSQQCPVTGVMVTHGFARRDLAERLRAERPIEVFCGSCAQLHVFERGERARLAQALEAAE